MSEVLFLILRRLRAPLITLIAAYGISVGGLALIPGLDAAGNPGRMSIFHAFYFMSFTATTIGFGEIPHPFSDAQRLWVIFAIYLSVVAWAYALGSVVTLANNATFRGALARHLFVRRVRGIAEPFYIICGYGQSGARLASSLDRLGNRLVIIEPSVQRIERVSIQDYDTAPLTLTADARLADVLQDAGIRSPHCQALVALAGEDDVNQAIAIGARFLVPEIQIVAREKSHVATANLEAFGGVQVVNPFETFAVNLGVALRNPEVLQLEEWLTAELGEPCPAPITLPRGPWILVGYGRFGHAIAEVLEREGVAWKTLDAGIERDADRDGLVRDHYSATILNDVGIAAADALLAGTDVDAVNLWVTTLARRVKPDIFVVIRQNHIQDRALVDAARANVTFVQSDLMVHECLQLLKTPTLGRFLLRLRDADPTVAATTIRRVRDESGAGSPGAWTFVCDTMQPGMFAAFFQNAAREFTIAHLLADPTNPLDRMRAVALMVERGAAVTLLPPDAMALKPGDRVLFVGNAMTRRLQRRYLGEPGTVSWVLSGHEPPRSLIFRWLEKRLRDRG
ncbi:MAG: NAD-binding protein [Betaproteobacteria bacterium]